VVLTFDLRSRGNPESNVKSTTPGDTIKTATV
jgi:hypothetical protein